MSSLFQEDHRAEGQSGEGLKTIILGVLMEAEWCPGFPFSHSEALQYLAKRQRESAGDKTCQCYYMPQNYQMLRCLQRLQETIFISTEPQLLHTILLSASERCLKVPEE